MIDAAYTALALKIYRTAQRNAETAGEKMPCSEALFAALDAMEPGVCDYGVLRGLENSDFLEAAFLTLLRRPADETARTNWMTRAELPPEEFQTQLLRSVLRSEEYTHSGVTLIHCPLPLNEDAPHTVRVAAYPERLLAIYRKMPAPLKTIAKKIAGGKSE